MLHVGPEFKKQLLCHAFVFLGDVLKDRKVSKVVPPNDDEGRSPWHTRGWFCTDEFAEGRGDEWRALCVYSCRV